LAECGIPREEFFITTKIWISNAGYENAKKSIEESLKKLRTEYMDLLLIHQPFGDYYGSYRAMEDAYEAGKVRAIGVSNFYPDRYIDIEHFAMQAVRGSGHGTDLITGYPGAPALLHGAQTRAA
jgi:diketogulonate reductase-like aldo/keto reductase